MLFFSKGIGDLLTFSCTDAFIVIGIVAFGVQAQYSKQTGWVFEPPLTRGHNESGTLYDVRAWHMIRSYHDVYSLIGPLSEENSSEKEYW